MVELTDAGLDYYFLWPLELADGFVVRQSANLGMMGAKNFMSPVLRSVIGRMGSSSQDRRRLHPPADGLIGRRQAPSFPPKSC